MFIEVWTASEVKTMIRALVAATVALAGQFTRPLESEGQSSRTGATGLELSRRTLAGLVFQLVSPQRQLVR